jgi:hypothetical protein
LKANRRYREDNRESDASSNDDDEIRPNGPITHHQIDRLYGCIL